jgi:hypothetical protein
LTAVGDRPVVWSAGSHQLFWEGGQAMPPAGAGDVTAAVLQQPGPAAPAVVFATPEAVVSQPLTGGEAVVSPPAVTGGRPAAPVVLGGCVFSVWNSSAAFRRDCPDAGDSLSQVVEGASPRDELKLRQNRGHVVLNQVNSGGLWLVTDDLEPVDNWDDVIPATDEGDELDESLQEQDEEVTPERSEDNHPPTAQDDSFGVRPGGSFLLPVVENDQDEDGDLLTAALDGPPPSVGTLGLVYADSVFQLTVPDDATGSSSFRYTVSDGRGGTASARVSLEVVRPESNRPPAPVTEREASRLYVSSGQKVSYNVLTDWRDPDGDEIFLVSAAPPGPEDVVVARPDGTIEFRDGGYSTGVKKVTVVVSDGREEATGELTVVVYPSGNHRPIVRPDLASGPVGSQIVVQPLLNDMDPDGQTLRLVDVSEPAGAQVTKDLDAGRFTVQGSRPGSFYFTYAVTDGPTAVESWVRVDVTDEAPVDAPPLAVPDTVLLPKGQEVLAAVLNNDVNPLGGPLVVTRVQAPDGAPVSAAVLSHANVKVTELRQFDQPVKLDYWVSNGKSTARSTLTVVSVKAPETILPPSAGDDEVRVRAGDIATVAVLANDSHPNGVPLRLRPELVGELPDPDSEALVFTAGNNIRVHARQTAGTYTVLYQVEATQGDAEPDTGRLTIHVMAPDPERNQPPRPQEVEARTVAGQPVTIKVPLDGIDPDGDYTVLASLGSAPGQGRVTGLTQDALVYDPGELTVGTVEFDYVVKDRLGAEGRAKIRVGVAGAQTQNHDPIANSDAVEVRPGRQVDVDVTANDADPDGDAIVLAADSARSDDFTVSTRDERLVFTAPTEEGDYSATYVIRDAWGQEATGVVTVKVRQDVALKKPLPRDDQVDRLEVLRSETGTVEVEVLKNDDDPDGDATSDDLRVEGDTAVASGGRVTVTLTAAQQLIDYSLTDPDGLVGHAFITVPGTDEIPPMLDPDSVGLEVKAGVTVQAALVDHVLVGPGKTPRATEASKLSAWNGAAALVSADTVSFVVPEDYVGPAAISLEVADSTDDAALRAMITIPVTVTAADKRNQPPELMGGRVEVEAGQEAQLGLADYVTDPDPDDSFSFTVSRPPALDGVTAAVDGPTLTVKAERTVAKGAATSLTLAVTDGHNDPVTAQVEIVVVASKQPLAQAVEDTEPNANQGKDHCLQVTANDVNPFPDTPLKVVAAAVETGQGSASTGCSGQGSVQVTPGASFVGQMVVRYTVEDATADPDRRVEGRIRLNVRGRPDAPAGLHVDQVGDQTVTLSWSPANNNGAPVTSYQVSGTPAYGPINCGTQTVCVLTGLTNNVTYTFTVTATNEVGTSEASMVSPEARPDTFPNHASPPTLVFGDTSLTVSWTYPGTRGSPVTGYVLEISPPPTNGIAQIGDPASGGQPGTTYIWRGLKNGTEYRVRICPVNAAPGVCEDEGQFSSYSAPEIPAKRPEPPAAPTAARLRSAGTESEVQLTWQQPVTNGAEIKSYQVVSSGGVTKTWNFPASAAGAPQTLSLPVSTNNITFQVKAENKAGWSDFSPASAPFRSIVEPGSVSNIATTDKDGACGLSFSPAALNGASASEVSYHYQVSNGAVGSFGISNSGTVTGLSNSQAYTFTVWAVTTVQGASYEGVKTTSGQCSPYGPPLKPDGNAQPEGAKAVRLWWGSAPPYNGRFVERVEYMVDNNGTWNHGGLVGGQIVVGDAYSELHCIKVRTVDNLGQISGENDFCATSNPRPAPWVNITQTQTASKVSGGGEARITWGNIPGSNQIVIYKGGKWTGCVFNTGKTEDCLSFYPSDANGSGINTSGGWKASSCGLTIQIEIAGTKSNVITWNCS